MVTPRILAFAGSTRRESFNKRLVAIAARGAEAAGATVTQIDLADFPLPLFDQDYEAQQGPPEQARKLKQLFLEHDGLLISSPEYNSSFSAVLKNAIDWVSRPAQGEPRLAAFQGKAAAVMSASPGGLGGLRGLVHLTDVLGNVGVLMLPSQASISSADQAFDAEGNLADDRKQEQILSLGRDLVALVRCRSEQPR